MERKEGESIKEWRSRVKSQKKERDIQNKIQSVKEQDDYGGELNESKIVVFRNQPTISQGYQKVGRKNNNRRVGQKSVFGERKYKPNRSLAERAINSFTDATGLTSPPTLKDGYERTLNAEVPLMESVQGQELKRMGKTAVNAGMIASIPFGGYQFYVNPLATSAAIASGLLVDQGTKMSLNEINEKLHERGKELTPGQQNAIRTAVGFTSGGGAYKWGERATKRGLEVAMHTTGAANPMRQIQDGWKVRNWKDKGKVINYILTGKNAGGNSNTLGWEWYTKTPAFYTGLNGPKTITNIPEYGRDAVRTYLYGEPLTSFKEVPNANLGVHETYVAKNYPNKNIKVYEANQPLQKGQFRPSEEPVHVGKKGFDEGIENVVDNTYSENFDAAGHYIEEGTYNGDLFTRHQDIWKFNSKDYMDKWLPNNKGVGILKNLPLKWGLDIVDYHGNPFIVRSPWVTRRTTGSDNDIDSSNALLKKLKEIKDSGYVPSWLE